MSFLPREAHLFLKCACKILRNFPIIIDNFGFMRYNCYRYLNEKRSERGNENENYTI